VPFDYDDRRLRAHDAVCNTHCNAQSGCICSQSFYLDCSKWGSRSTQQPKLMLWSKFDHASRIANMAMRPPYVRRQFSVHLLATTASTSSPITRRRISSHTGSRLCVHSWSSARLHKSTANIRRKGGWCDKTCVEWSLSQQSFTSFKKLPTPTTVCLRFTAITQKLAEKSQLEIKVQDETWHDVNRKVALTPNKWGMHECQLAATCRQSGSYVLQYSQHW